MFELNGRVAVVTGAGYGLGSEFAGVLGAYGATVVCADIDLGRARRVEVEIAGCGGTALAEHVDVADEASVEDLFGAVASKLGRVDILVNNAGIATPPVRMHELALADWDRLFSINLRGAFLCSRSAVKMMLEAQRGSIINIASLLGLRGLYPGFTATAVNYGASKAGLIGFTRQIAVEYARDGIRANVIAPGFHGGTDLGRERRAAATSEDIARFETAIHQAIPMGRRGLPSELRGLALYLASDASSYVTGQVFAHDGGWTAA
jgi:NAD(P)-dependent dehydrogenase (short-subunit alcohol dehydrogenase family)